MPFGHRRCNYIMKKYFSLLLLAAVALICSCVSCNNNNQLGGNITLNPEAGTNLKSGQPLNVRISYGGIKPDSIIYLLDSLRVGVKKDSSAMVIKTDTMKLGIRTITAKIFEGGKQQDISTNIVLLSSVVPEEYTFKIEKVFPHDTASFTEGLQYADGYLYESAGEYGQSELRKVELNTGKVIQRIKLDTKYFGEGIAVVGNKIMQLTYKEKVGFVYDKSSFKLLDTFTNNVGIEGWGVCYDGSKIYMDDSSNRIWFLDKNNYHQVGYVDVYDDKRPIDSINEMEYINDKLYVNVWQTDTIIAVNPKTGVVLQRIDLSTLYPKSKRNPNADVLNGIAYDKVNNRIFITGKKWDKLFQVKFLKK